MTPVIKLRSPPSTSKNPDGISSTLCHHFDVKVFLFAREELYITFFTLGETGISTKFYENLTSSLASKEPHSENVGKCDEYIVANTKSVILLWQR